MFEQIYHDYLIHKNEENRKDRYEGKENWYHASGAGFCSRKLYYESVEKAEPTNPPKEKSMRVMRLGTIIHEDVQNALIYYNNIYNKDNNKVISDKVNIAVDESFVYETEGEVELPQFNVRGYFDVLARGDSSAKLYDIKTTSGWGFRQKFNFNTVIPTENRNHFLQVATYGLAIKERLGFLSSMHICYYNKDNSDVEVQTIPEVYLDKARRYWYSINEEHSKGVPEFKLGVSPAYKWCCGYCQFKDHCNPPKKIY